MRGLTIDEMTIGQEVSVSKTISEADVYLFAGITGDHNPAHLNAVEAEKTPFKARIAHGMLSAGLISAAIGMRLPGPGTIYVKQDLKFTAPVYFGDTVTATVRVAEIMKEKNRVRLETVCSNQHGKNVIVGEAMVMPPREM